MKFKHRKTPEGHAFLNIGCGSHFFPEWNNLDLVRKTNVTYWDIRRPLPYADGAFDGTYSSHVLEHLSPEAGSALMQEQFRVLRPGGICRIVVPDLEGICRQYLASMEQAWSEENEENLRNYRWMTLELLDQMVREESGGQMRKTLVAQDFNAGFVRQRMGDQFKVYYDRSTSPSAAKPPSLRKQISRFLKNPSTHGGDPRKTGEAHRWMYDRLSLRQLCKATGFADFKVTTWNESRLPDWTKYNLDRADEGVGPRKPDSIFVECRKPAA